MSQAKEVNGHLIFMCFIISFHLQLQLTFCLLLEVFHLSIRRMTEWTSDKIYNEMFLNKWNKDTIQV